MALFQVTVTQKGRNKDFDETLLLNTKRVVDIYPDGDDDSIFYYSERDDRKQLSTEYHIGESQSDFVDILHDATEKENEGDRVFLTFTAETKGVKETPFDEDISFNKDMFIKGIEDSEDSDKSHIWIARGAFSAIKFKVDASLSEIEEEASKAIA